MPGAWHCAPKTGPASPLPPKLDIPPRMEWVSVTTLPMEGRGWPVDELGTPFDRLPAR
eukprot:COSAG04_NODE_66_length_29513_cov_208.948732_8_plen_58_part_00